MRERIGLTLCVVGILASRVVDLSERALDSTRAAAILPLMAVAMTAFLIGLCVAPAIR